MKLSKWLPMALILAALTASISATAFAQGPDSANGKKLFDQNCAVCHGDRAQGRVGATLNKDFPGIRVDVLLRDIISNGVQGSVMPAWSKGRGGPLTEKEIDDIVSYIRSLGNLAPTFVAPTGPPATRPPLPSPAATFPPGDATRGQRVYAENCALCHGANGEGRVGATLVKDFPGINVEAFLDSTISRGVAGSKMPAWGQSNGGPLTNQNIADVAVYIRTFKRPSQLPTETTPFNPEAGPSASILAVICVGLVALVAVVVLMFGLAGSRSKT